MARRWIWIGLAGFLIALLSAGLASARIAPPPSSQLPSQLIVSHLSPLQTTTETSLQFLNSLPSGDSDVTYLAKADLQLAQAAPPRQVTALADPSNYGDRYATDIDGRVVQNDFIAVLHETVGSAQSALNLFRTHHPRDQDQVSYHALIGRDGTIYYIVPPEKRAFGAGNSVFNGPNGPETVRTNAAFPPSVNNFAYHISLETPGDGMNNRRSHSGYTQAQYASLAWLLAQTTIPDSRITTHQAVDRSGNRMDPRSFNGQGFFALLRRYPTRSGLSG